VTSQAARTHPARTQLEELTRRSSAGTVPPLEGPHRFDPDAARDYRPAAVLALFAPTLSDSTQAADPGVDVFLVQRSRHLRHHPGQISLPGGGLEPRETPTEAAVRETHEEIGLPPEKVEVLGQLPPVLVPVSRFVVHPVLGWTHASGFERAQAGEVLHCLRVAVGDLLDPAARRAVRIAEYPHSQGSCGFQLPVGWVWGFTGNLLDHLFTHLGWDRPWDTSATYLMPMAEALGRGVSPLPTEEEPPTQVSLPTDETPPPPAEVPQPTDEAPPASSEAPPASS